MKAINGSLLTITLAIASSQLYADDYNMKFGLWESTTTTEILGVPEEMKAMMSEPPETERECITSLDDIFEGSDDIPCDYETKRINSGKMTIDLTCSEDGMVATGKGEMIFKGETASSWLELKTESLLGPMTLRFTTEGKYIGQCS